MILLSITLDLITNILTVVVAATAVFVAINVRKLESKDDPENIKTSLEKIRLKASSHSGEAEKTESFKRNIEEEKYALFLQYHTQSLAQSKISFWFSLIFACIGFAVIITGILTIQQNVSIWEQGKSFITLVSGVIIDGVSALFFVQSNKARKLMITFFDKLREDRKFEESLKIAEQIPDPILKSKLQVALAINFANIKSDTLLSQIIGEQKSNVSE